MWKKSLNLIQCALSKQKSPKEIWKKVTKLDSILDSKFNNNTFHSIQHLQIHFPWSLSMVTVGQFDLHSVADFG